MQEREGFLDKLRVAATCAVVLLHTITGVMDTTDMSRFPFENKLFLAALDLICWCVPVFIMISGYLFLNPIRKISMKDMLTKYCRRIVFALFLFGVPYACLEQIVMEHAFGIEMLGRGFLMVLRGQSWSHMWYLYLILILYLLTPALKWLLERTPRAAVYGLLWGIAVVSSILPCLAAYMKWDYPTALLGKMIYLFYYMCGYLFVACKDSGIEGVRREVLKRALPGALGVLALASVISRLSGICTARTAYNDPLAVLPALLLFGTGYLWSGNKGAESPRPRNEGQGEESPASRNRKPAVELAFAVYLIHPVFLNFCYKALRITPLDFAIWISLPLFFLGTLLSAAGTAWVLRRIPVLRKYVL